MGILICVVSHFAKMHILAPRALTPSTYYLERIKNFQNSAHTAVYGRQLNCESSRSNLDTRAVYLHPIRR